MTALKFARSEGKSDCFVSGDATGIARVWLERDGEVRRPRHLRDGRKLISRFRSGFTSLP